TGRAVVTLVVPCRSAFVDVFTGLAVAFVSSLASAFVGAARVLAGGVGVTRVPAVVALVDVRAVRRFAFADEPLVDLAGRTTIFRLVVLVVTSLTLLEHTVATRGLTL